MGAVIKKTTTAKSKADARRQRTTNGRAASTDNRIETNGSSKSDYLDPRLLLSMLTAVKKGVFSSRMPSDESGVTGKIYDALNDIIEKNETLTSELKRISESVGRQGKISQRVKMDGASGDWNSCIESVNSLITDLTQPTTEVARVIGAVAEGDLSQNFNLEIDGRPLRGEFLRTGKTVNTMVTQLSSFASEVTRVAREVGTEGKLGGQANVPGASGTWRDLTDNVNQLAANLTSQVRAMADVATAVTKGDLTRTITVDASGEVAFLKDNVNEMIRNLRETTQKNTEQDWLKTNLAKFTRLLQGQRDLLTVARMILSEMAPLVEMQHGVFYIADTFEAETVLRLLASYAYRERKSVSNEFRLGESIVGQCALEKERIIITSVPPDYVKINSGLGEAAPTSIVVLPVTFEGQVKAVIELASFEQFNENQLGFLDQLTESIGIVMNTIEANMRTEELLKQSQSLAQELQVGQEELQETNSRLELQAQSLQTSEELLKHQQEELQQTNQELEDKARLLSEQKAEVEQKNREIEFARVALEDKAKQLALSSKYKSEFLANMSHELRTPLNSMLILSKMLADNPDQKLNDKQVEFAETIYSSGADLLALINEILDLSKIESGTMGVEISEVYFADLCDDIERTFSQIAQDKSIEFIIETGGKLPENIQTDAKRLRQVLKNLLSNAFKFTDEGRISLKIEVAENGWGYENEILNQSPSVLAFFVSDTGIGIPEEKQRLIFEAFQQADGTTSRKYGGTGLGLSISREIARLLGGEIKLESVSGEGSTFTFYLPENFRPTDLAPEDEADEEISNAVTYQQHNLISSSRELQENTVRIQAMVSDDRAEIKSGDRVLLVIEDDASFARILLDIGHEQGFKCLVAQHGEDALTTARKYLPDAITLDLTLPGMHGYAVLDRLKHDPSTRHIPVQIISVIDDMKRVLKLGALGNMTKPVNRERLVEGVVTLRDFVERPVKRLLLVEDDKTLSQSIIELISGDDIEITPVVNGKEALKKLQTKRFDCAIVDLMLPDMEWSELIEKIKQKAGFPELPVIVHTGRDLTRRETSRIKKLAETIIIKDAGSMERLVDETALFLHRDLENLTEGQKNVVKKVKLNDPRLEGKKVLVVDDDIRNIFALTSALERQQMQVVYAENGRDGIEMLKKTPGIAGVLMDIMMPEMDGYEAMREIRRLQKFKQIPIIAVTAKAMKGDRQKCIEAGASDYITKPVDIEQLLSLLRIWLDK